MITHQVVEHEKRAGFEGLQQILPLSGRICRALIGRLDEKRFVSINAPDEIQISLDLHDSFTKFLNDALHALFSQQVIPNELDTRNDFRF